MKRDGEGFCGTISRPKIRQVRGHTPHIRLAAKALSENPEEPVKASFLKISQPKA
jgi:hypothetical protein